jgi:hypothetical protein
MTTASRVVPRPNAGIIEALRRHRLMAGAVTIVYLLTYLWSIGDIVVTATDRSRFGAVPPIQVAPDWPAKLLRQTAPFSYEPILAARLAGHIQLFLAPVNVALALLLSGLVGANLAAAVHLYRTAPICRRRSFAGLLGVLPGFLSGFACCAPTLTLLLGAQIAAALIGLRNSLFPLALAFLVAGLAWSARSLAGREPPTDPGALPRTGARCDTHAVDGSAPGMAFRSPAPSTTARRACTAARPGIRTSERSPRHLPIDLAAPLKQGRPPPGSSLPGPAAGR